MACARVLLVCIAAIILQLLFFSPPYPPYLDAPASLLPAPSNAKLQEVVKLGEGLLRQPEDIAVDRNGVLYTATRDGSVKRMHTNGSWENWRQIQSEALLGITATSSGDLFICDADKGLLKVNDEDSVTVVATHVNGTKIWFADDVIGSSDGMLYLSDASTKFTFHNWRLDILETEPHGRLLKHDISSDVTSILVQGLAFPNGVALSQNEDYLVVCETWKYRCLKYWLEGDKIGETEIFIDNLPGRPDNINLAPDGSFWIALLQIIPMWPRFVYSLPASKYILGALKIPVIRVGKGAVVVNVGSDGKMIGGFDDPTGKVMNFVTSAVEFEGDLYFGSLYNDFVGKLHLTPPSP